jgi:predicted type IV restriction endonuclease
VVLVQEPLLSFIREIKSDSRVLSYDEAAVKQAIIMRILDSLGWNPFNINEVKPEYSVAGRRVDYSLRIHDTNKVFLEVKKTGEELDRHQEQLLDYSFKEGVKLAVLTNGMTWWFYLPLQEGSWEQRKFFAIDILQQEPAHIADRFQSFLSHSNVESGKAIQNAELLYRTRKKDVTLKAYLPKAWNKIVLEPHELLVEMINETLEAISGFKANNEQIEAFLKSHMTKLTIIEGLGVGHNPERPPIKAEVPPNITDNYIGTTVIGFCFRGQHYTVRSWRDLLLTLVKVIRKSHQHEMDKCLQLVGRTRPFFTRNRDELREPIPIEGTGIYVEGNIGANSIARISRRLVGVFGYQDSDFSIEARESRIKTSTPNR